MSMVLNPEKGSLWNWPFIQQLWPITDLLMLFSLENSELDFMWMASQVEDMNHL